MFFFLHDLTVTEHILDRRRKNRFSLEKQVFSSFNHSIKKRTTTAESYKKRVVVLLLSEYNADSQRQPVN